MIALVVLDIIAIVAAAAIIAAVHVRAPLRLGEDLCAAPALFGLQLYVADPAGEVRSYAIERVPA
jgi:hypothetical protein